MPAASPPGGEARLALGAALSAYLIWSLAPLVFQVIGREGVSAWEMAAHRSIWAVPTALIFVGLAKQGDQVRAVLRTPRTLAWLTLSAVLIAINWVVFIWAVNSGRVIESSLGYYINPLLSMAAGALIFRERIDGVGLLAIGLATIGVALQTLALGHLPLVSLALGLSFCVYGIVRKRVAADAQTGLLVECMILAVPGLIYVAWLQAAGAGEGFNDAWTFSWLVFCGPLTAAPLMLFAWAARRTPLSAMGFLQFIGPTFTFGLGVWQGEAFTPLRALSFVFIWGGAAVFAWGVWRTARRIKIQSAA
jgi:chloramphenicol-sensitive protein RarD